MIKWLKRMILILRYTFREPYDVAENRRMREELNR